MHEVTEKLSLRQTRFLTSQSGNGLLSNNKHHLLITHTQNLALVYLILLLLNHSKVTTIVLFYR